MRSEAATSEPMKLPPTTSALRASAASRDGRRVGESSERVHGRQVGARHGERAWTGTARDDERPVRERLAGREAHGVRIRVQRGDRGLEPELDDLILVLLGRVDERLGRLHLAAQDALRERRPVVGRVLVRQRIVIDASPPASR